MGLVDVPGARLYYELQGSGSLLVVIPGAGGTAGRGQTISELAAHYTVLTYDRRGFSRSQLDGPQDYAHRLETDADDARRLIEHVGAEPATIFGASSGGIVALEVLRRHPSVVRTMVPHEPPAVRLLPDGQAWVDFFFAVYDRYCQDGIGPALAMFRLAFTEADRRAMEDHGGERDPKSDELMRANATYWFEHELRQYPAFDLDLDALQAQAARVVLVAGRESRGYPCSDATIELGKKLDRDVIELPGGHIGFLTHPVEFARALRDSLG
jgi:pimeloyl-ACP methyl ester carboxylesterase